MLSLFRPDPAKVDRLIAGFPGPLYLRASAIKWWSIIAAGPAFTILWGWMVMFAHFKPGSAAGDRAGLVFLGVVVGLLIVVLGRKRLKGSLRLDHDGFLISAQTQYRWCDVSDFAKRHVPKAGDMVAFAIPREMEPRLVGGAYWPGMDLAPQSVPRTPEVDPFFLVRDHVMPDTYGLSTDDLARLMNDWRNLALPTEVADRPGPRLRDAPRFMEKSR
jgi:hypothetical protein